MFILGIESTAHTFGAAIVDDTKRGGARILSNVRRMATTKKGGMIPAKVADHHEEQFSDVIDEAFRIASEKHCGARDCASRTGSVRHRDSVRSTAHIARGQRLQGSASLSWKDIGLIAVSNAPGIGHALRIGVAVARTLSMRHNIPVIGVNHCIAHLEVASLVTDAKDPVLLYCSGANTQVIAYDGGKYRIFGETLDTGIGNFLDTFARDLGLGFPGGPAIEKLANACTNKKTLIDMPYSVKGMDVAFSGILTNINKKIKAGERARAREGWSDEALSYSVQESVFAMLVEVAERAMAHCNKNELVLGGGVACNKRLQEMCKLMCTDRKAQCFIPENQFLVDNAAMIAWTGTIMHNAGIRHKAEDLVMHPYERTDNVDVVWRD